MGILDTIRNPQDLNELSEEQLNQVAASTDLCVAETSKGAAANKAGG